MSKKISAIDSERIFTQDIGHQFFFEAPRSSKLRPSEGNSLFAAMGARALTTAKLQISKVIVFRRKCCKKIQSRGGSMLKGKIILFCRPKELY